MEIIKCSPEMSVDRMYCPSTDEVIFAPDYEMINDNADAFIAYWHGEVLTEPEIKDPKLEEAWEATYRAWDEQVDTEIDIWDLVDKFLAEYENPGWIVYECTFYGMACGPVSTTVYFVVKNDTIIEEDPDFDAEEEEEDLKNMSEEEFTNMVIGQQLGALTRAIEKEENKKKRNKKE